MVTRQQIIDAPYHQIWHYTGKHECSCVVGARGAIHVNFVAYRGNGRVKLWKTRPNDFRLPTKYGLREGGWIDQDNAHEWHLEQDCPALIKAQELHKEALYHAGR